MGAEKGARLFLLFPLDWKRGGRKVTLRRGRAIGSKVNLPGNTDIVSTTIYVHWPHDSTPILTGRQGLLLILRMEMYTQPDPIGSP